MISHVLSQCKAMAEKCACADATDQNAMYDLVSNLIYCVDILATEIEKRDRKTEVKP